MRRFLVTGATGRIGSRVTARLIDAGCCPRLFVRQQDSLRMDGEGIEVVTGSFDDTDSIARALAGVDCLFLYTPPRFDAELFNVIANGNVQRVVLLSSASVEKVPESACNPIAQRHRRTEQALQGCIPEWAFLRPDLLASNALQWAPAIRRFGAVRTAYPQSLRNPIHEDDVARLAVHEMLAAQERRKTYLLTGPVVLSIWQQIQMIAAGIGRPVGCSIVSREDAMSDYLRQHPNASVQVASLLLDYQRKAVFQAPACSNDFFAVFGQRPRGFEQWVSDHKSAFMPENSGIITRMPHTS